MRSAHLQFIKAQRDIIRELIEEYDPHRFIYYTLTNQPNIFHSDDLDDLLDEEEVIYEIIFDQRSIRIFVCYIRSFPYASFELVRQDFRDDIPEGPPEFDSDGNEIRSDYSNDSSSEGPPDFDSDGNQILSD
jgi:hypothetical protein